MTRSTAWRPCWIALALICAATGCRKSPPAVTSAPTTPSTAVDLPSATTSIVCSATVNAIGVGKPCRVAADCRGQLAITCPRASDPKGLDFCTRACTGTERDECGEGAVCVPQGTRPSICVPTVCSRQLAVELPLDTTVIADCQAPPNAAGVGKPCASHADCAGNAQAKTCGSSVPGQRKPDVCTVGCQRDADCGRNAACVDLDWNLRGDGKASGQKRFCLPACWAQ